MLSYPIVLDDNELPFCILHNAFDVVISDEVLSSSSGSETLEFKMPYNDKKRKLIDNEDIISCYGRKFIVRTIDDDKSSNYYAKIYCEALWYEIANGDPVMSCKFSTVPATDILHFLLDGTEWSIGTVEPTCKRSLESNEPMSRLQLLRQLPILYGCEMYFDTFNKKVNLVNQVGEDTQTLISYYKNTDSIVRNIDSRDIITRVYLYGKDKLNVKDINKGFDYIENFGYYEELGKRKVIKSTVINDDRFLNPNALMEYGKNYLETNCRPKYSYNVKLYVVGKMLNLGDRVIVYDKDLEVKGYMRIISRKVNVLEIEQSELQLDNKLKNFTNQMAENTLTDSSDTATLSNDALNEVSLFNLLLNSRADYGFNYWVNNGFTIDNTLGVTGNASFKCIGELGKEKSISQDVDVSNRDIYTLSAQVEINDLVRNSNSEVGFEVTLEYDDGTTETQFISII